MAFSYWRIICDALQLYESTLLVFIDSSYYYLVDIADIADIMIVDIADIIIIVVVVVAVVLVLVLVLVLLLLFCNITTVM